MRICAVYYEDAKITRLDSALEYGIEIPEPVIFQMITLEKLNIHITKSIYRTLAERARDEKVSLNTTSCTIRPGVLATR